MTAFEGSLDTNTLLRLLLNDVPHQHAQVVQLLAQYKNQFAVADTVITEVVFVLNRGYKFSRTQIAEAIEGLMGITQINCNRTLFQKALQLFTAHPALSMEDCVLCVYAELNDATPLWTFDKKLANQVEHARLVVA